MGDLVENQPDEEEKAWQRLATEQFLKGYGPGDKIYDDYEDRSES